MRSRRNSLGGTALRDASAYQNAHRSSSVSRRQSSIGGADSLRSETPVKDRLTLLDDWRRNKTRSRESGIITDENGTTTKRAKMRSQHPPPLPPSSQPSPGKPVFCTEGTTAIERFRLRKQMRIHEQNGTTTTDESFISASSLSQEKEDINESFLSQSSTSLLSTTPSRHLGSARRQSLSVQSTRGPRSSLLPPSSQDSVQSTHQSFSLSQQSVNESEVSVDTAEGAGLRSRVREMQQRVEKLEKEKMVLSMSKAPLEARFRQKEDAWLKEQNRLLQEMDSLKEASKEGDEQYRDLQMQHEAIEEECKRLRFQVRKASSSLNNNSSCNSTNSNAGDSGWLRQVQNDRDVAELKEKLRHAEDEINSIRLVKVSVEKSLHATQIELASVLRSFDALQQEYDDLSRSTSNNNEAEIQLEVLTTEHIATSAQLNAACSDLAATKAHTEAAMEEKEAEHKKDIKQLQFAMSVLKTRAARVDDYADKMLESEIEDDAVLKARIEERDGRIQELEALLLRGEEQRRRMHNNIQELRGNIRVYVRTRPFLPSDKTSAESAIEVSLDGESLSILDTRSAAPHGFKFDKVFPPSAGQDLVFKEVSDFVQSALDGYNVCLFSYGQTGSGKTHTMQGSGNGAMRGIIPRAVEQILVQVKVLQSQKWDFKLSASFLEIYNEELRDLLVSMSKDKAAVSKSQKLAIKRSREGKSYVDGLTEVPIETSDSVQGMQQLEALMASAARSRSVASTKMNAQSSRGHSVFMLHLRGFNEESGAIVEGAMNLCDLAGSERLDRSGAGEDAQRLRETQAINKSLSCLGDVFNALAQRANHVPYRNSKLTYLLQDCLSGDGKALMFVNLSPTTESSNESLCSLRFAQRVNQVELGKPTKNMHYSK
jgi:kinesin family protein C1